MKYVPKAWKQDQRIPLSETDVIIEDRFTVGASPERVWRFFLDVPRAAVCMPGVERVEEIDARRYRGQIRVRIGPMKAAFAMEVTIDELLPPETIRVSARGTDRGTSSFVDAKATVGIRPITEPIDSPISAQSVDNGRSEVTLAIDVALRGPLGRFGQVVIRDTARKMTEQFLACAERTIIERRASSPVPPGVEASAGCTFGPSAEASTPGGTGDEAPPR